MLAGAIPRAGQNCSPRDTRPSQAVAILERMPERILVADEDIAARSLIVAHLLEGGWEVTEVDDGAAALTEIRASRPDLVLLDLALPEVPGLEVCRRVRRDPETATLPLIVVSARAAEVDRVVAFEVGVDDFVEKPFSARELALRVRAVLRRALPSPPLAPTSVTAGPLVIDGARHRAMLDGRDLALTALELKLLTFLATNSERVHSRENLLERVWGLDPDMETRTVDTHVKRLRAKLGHAGGLIETLRGVGYRLRAVAATPR